MLNEIFLKFDLKCGEGENHDLKPDGQGTTLKNKRATKGSLNQY